MVTLIHFKQDGAYRVLAWDAYATHAEIMQMIKEDELRVDDNRVMLTYQDSI